MAEKLFLTVSASALNLFELFNETNFKFQILFRIDQAIMRELYTAEKTNNLNNNYFLVELIHFVLFKLILQF